MTTILGTILAIIRAIIFFVSMALIISVFLVIGVFYNWEDKDRYAIRRLWIKIFMSIGNIHVTKTGVQQNIHPAIYIANHRALSDIFIFKYIDAKTVAKAELSTIPVVGKAGDLTGVIWVKREQKSSRTAVRETMGEYLKKGTSILLFPEGTTHDNYAVKQFKTGSFRVAQEVGVPIIPVVLEFKDMEMAWVDGSLTKHYFEIFKRWRIDMKLHFGEPFYVDDYKKSVVETELYYNNVLHDLQKGWSKSFPLGRDTNSRTYPKIG